MKKIIVKYKDAGRLFNPYFNDYNRKKHKWKKHIRLNWNKRNTDYGLLGPGSNDRVK